MKSNPIYEIYALKYAGPFTSSMAFVLWNEGWDRQIERNYYVWAIKGSEGWTIVDTGTGVSMASQRQLSRYVNPVEVLARIGINGDNVSTVILTHIHFDHAGGIEMFPDAFPKAKFYVQRKEFDFWINSPFAKRKPFQPITDMEANKAIGALKGTDRLVIVNGDRKIIPGVELLLAPGHTVGLQTVAVNTARGTAIIASDCAHVARSLKEDIPSCLIMDMVGWLVSYDKLRARASSIDLIFPGHDTRMLTDYPMVTKDVTRLA